MFYDIASIISHLLKWLNGSAILKKLLNNLHFVINGWTCFTKILLLLKWKYLILIGHGHRSRSVYKRSV